MVWLYVAGFLFVFIGVSAFFGAPYLPSRRRDLRRVFDQLRPVGKDDVVLDIGSGDGVVLREVSRRGAKAVGYEIHPLFVRVAKLLSRHDSNVVVRWANAWTTPFPDDVTLVYIFSVGRDARKLERAVQKQVDRLQRPLELLCYGNPLPNRSAKATFEAYSLYEFQPLHQS